MADHTVMDGGARSVAAGTAAIASCEAFASIPDSDALPLCFAPLEVPETTTEVLDTAALPDFALGGRRPVKASCPLCTLTPSAAARLATRTPQARAAPGRRTNMRKMRAPSPRAVLCRGVLAAWAVSESRASVSGVTCTEGNTLTTPDKHRGTTHHRHSNAKPKPTARDLAVRCTSLSLELWTGSCLAPLAVTVAAGAAPPAGTSRGLLSHAYTPAVARAPSRKDNTGSATVHDSRT